MFGFLVEIRSAFVIHSAMQERRRHKRMPLNGVYGNMFLTFDNIEIVNMNPGGAAIRLKRNLVVGKEYFLKFDDEGRHMELKCTVVWSGLKEQRNNPATLYHAGIKFDDIFTGKAATLIDFIESHRFAESKERLRSQRIIIDSPKNVVICEPLWYKVKLISPFGMLIETTQPVNPEARFPMELLLKDISPLRVNYEKSKDILPVQNFFQSNKVIEFCGRIVSCTKIKDSNPQSYAIGVEFLEMQAKDWSSLSSFAHSL